MTATLDLRKARRITGTSRAELKRAIGARESRLRPIVRHAMAQMAARLTRPELRHAWAMGGQAHAGLVAAARQAWTDAIPALVAALAAPLQKQDELLPTTAQQLAEREIGALIRDLADRQLLAVQAQLAALMDQGPSDAVLGAIARATGLTANQTAAVGRFVAAQLSSGASEQTALRAAETYADRLLAQRAQLIARTEAVRYTSQLVLERGADVGGIVVKQWVSARDENVDAICRALDNDERIPLEQPFTAFGLEFQGPPAHPGCRCVPEIWRVDA